MTAVARVRDIKLSRTADFKGVGDGIYLLGPARLGVIGSELQQMLEIRPGTRLEGRSLSLGRPSWSVARRVYEWIGGGLEGVQSDGNTRLQSLHDVSEGGVLVAVAESLFARNFGAEIHVPEGKNPWEFSFGEGFHSFVATVARGSQKEMETEWMRLDVPFIKIGEVTHEPILHVNFAGRVFSVSVVDLRSAWSNQEFLE